MLLRWMLLVVALASPSEDLARGFRVDDTEGWVAEGGQIRASDGLALQLSDTPAGAEPHEQLSVADIGRELGIPVPDATVFLHVPADIGFELVAKKDERAYLNGKVRDIHEGDREHLRAAEDAYVAVTTLDTVEHWKTIECMDGERLKSIDEVHAELWNLVQPLLGRTATP